MAGLGRRSIAAAVMVAVGISASGCGGSSGSSDDGTGKPVTVTITERNGKISPDDGHVIDVEKGQKVQLVVTTDAADEIHVHSVPEHEFEVKAGASHEKLPAFTISTPGRFIIESHGLDLTLVTLQVS